MFKLNNEKLNNYFILVENKYDVVETNIDDWPDDELC